MYKIYSILGTPANGSIAAEPPVTLDDNILLPPLCNTKIYLKFDCSINSQDVLSVQVHDDVVTVPGREARTVIGTVPAQVEWLGTCPPVRKQRSLYKMQS